jgi:hypothetical protein
MLKYVKEIYLHSPKVISESARSVVYLCQLINQNQPSWDAAAKQFATDAILPIGDVKLERGCSLDAYSVESPHQNQRKNIKSVY